MEIINLSDKLKSMMAGIKVKMDAWPPMAEGESLLNHTVIFTYANIECNCIDVSYGLVTLSSLPSPETRQVYRLVNCLDVADKKSLGVDFSYTESTTATKSVTVTEGSSVTLKADTGIKMDVVSAGVGLSETKTLNLQKVDSNVSLKQESKVERYDLSYELAPQTAIEVAISKELQEYRQAFGGKILIDGDILVTVRRNSDGQMSGRFAPAGRISAYLPAEKRLLEVQGEFEHIKGTRTTRSARSFPVSKQPDLCAGEQAAAGHAALLAALWQAPEPAFGRASVRLANIRCNAGIYYADFDIETPGCDSSAASGFDVVLVIERDGGQHTQRTSIEGWEAGESVPGGFRISRSGNYGEGEVVDIINIQQPDFNCFDKER
ncbi:hypothetical protein GJ697_05595 [Pseudoduganella sp. FT25W]|uniref:Uncharacterized protein n=1 Tax=Duganella alba TaxID=2666081 RepID=A0A6L5QC64_9BURK|nr:hypothetical protein [Duganella alba]MRX07305.1 hypothetical protein [Duganella alba]MRX15000.1 hypothetical protein [Duganella alba]